MSNSVRASDAWAMGNLGLSTKLRNEADLDQDGYETGAEPGDVEYVPWLVRMRWKLVRWTLAAGVFVAYINHWPGGSH